MKIHPKSLEQRTYLYVLLPTFILLVVLSSTGFLLVRGVLMEQWGDNAIGNLKAAAHQVDMQLARPKQLLQMLEEESGNGGGLVEGSAGLGGSDHGGRPGKSNLSAGSLKFASHILNRIEQLEGVVQVNVRWPEPETEWMTVPAVRQMIGGMGMMHRYRMTGLRIGPPRFDHVLNNRTISLVSEFVDGDTMLGFIEVVLSFDDLISKLVNTPWWRNYKAYLVDEKGDVLISTGVGLDWTDNRPVRLFEAAGALERDTYAAMQRQRSGAVFGPGVPPEEISGFLHLQEAPWTIVVIAPGSRVLEPIITFSYAYIGAIAVVILAVLLLIRITTGKVTEGIKEISLAAEDLAAGRFGPPLPVRSMDEVGELTRSFNKMSRQLRQRLAMKEAIDLAREVQQNLLPSGSFYLEGVEVAGRSIYCDETGGDYFDIFEYPAEKRLAVAVGDVVGHGIGAALLMTTVRALLRSRLKGPGGPEIVIRDVNRMLYHDTCKSGSFVTMFFLEVDRQLGIARWIRAGHEPALVYTPEDNSFLELRGKGLALGIDPDFAYSCTDFHVGHKEQLILVGSDGLWEIENRFGERFGKERLRRLIAENCHESPENLIALVGRKLREFCKDAAQTDDITLVVIKSRV